MYLYNVKISPKRLSHDPDPFPDPCALWRLRLADAGGLGNGEPRRRCGDLLCRHHRRCRARPHDKIAPHRLGSGVCRHRRLPQRLRSLAGQLEGEAGGRRRHLRDLDRLDPDPLPLYPAIRAGIGPCRDRGDAGLPARQLHHHRCLDRGRAFDDAEQYGRTLHPGPADLAEPSGRARRAQQCGPFHQMVSSISTDEIRRPAARRAAEPALIAASRRQTMRDVFLRLGTDFLSTIIFLVTYVATDNIVLATSVAIASAIGQVIYARIRGRPLHFMTWASLALVIVLGGATILTRDPRFVLAKPAIAHFAIGAIMLKRGWMLRYMPPIAVETIPEYITFAGYAWAVLMFALGAGTIAIALTGDLKLWTIYVSVVAVGAKIAAFAVQYVAFRFLITGRVRAARPAGT